MNWTKMTWIGALCVLLLAAQGVNAAEASLDALREGHPRLILTDEGLQQLKKTIAQDATAQDYYQRLIKLGDRLMQQKPVDYIIVGPRLLTQSRNCLERVYTYGLLYRLDGDRKWFDRAKQEVFAAIRFPDWNPSHFLDTAEMSHAIGIAYDWFYDQWTPEERSEIVDMLVKKGLTPAREGYENNAWWSHSEHNWNQVCNGGIGIGALAVADIQPELAGFLLKQSVQDMPLALKSYAPDGGWGEGPGYWHYATRYTVYFFAALDTALRTDFGLSDAEGLRGAGGFRIHSCGLIGMTFNYADAGSGAGAAHEMFWLAQRYNEPILAWHERETLKDDRISALDLIWYTPIGTDPASSGFARDALYRGINVAFSRSAWNDPKAIYLGFKGGDNKTNHSHLDLGCFVLDADGVRWALDLGGDDYNLPGYFGAQRWTYFRLNTQSHNTLIVNGGNQDPSAPAPIIGAYSSDDLAWAAADLSQAYPDLKMAQRGVAMIERSMVLIQDEIAPKTSADVQWGMLTDAEIETHGASATLSKSGEKLEATILSPAGASFEWIDGNPPKPQKQHEGAKKLVINLKGVDKPATIAVMLAPYRGKDAAPGIPMNVKPIDQWKQ